MKNLLIITTFAFVVIGCNKVTEKNLQGTWKGIEYKENGVSTPFAGEIIMEFDGTTVTTTQNGQVIGSVPYTLDKKNQIINAGTDTWTIIELKGGILKFTHTVLSTVHEYHLEKQ